VKRSGRWRDVMERFGKVKRSNAVKRSGIVGRSAAVEKSGTLKISGKEATTSAAALRAVRMSLMAAAARVPHESWEKDGSL
jgi:hypothetical protein